MRLLRPLRLLPLMRRLSFTQSQHRPMCLRLRIAIGPVASRFGMAIVGWGREFKCVTDMSSAQSVLSLGRGWPTLVHRHAGNRILPACSLFLVAWTPHVLPRVRYDLSARDLFHSGLIGGIDVLGVEFLPFLSVFGWRPNRNSEAGVGGRARLAVSGADQYSGNGCRYNGPHPDAPFHSSRHAL